MSNLLTRLRRNTTVLSFAAIFAVLGLSVLGSVLTPQVTNAWCDNVGISFDNVCVSRNYDELPQSVKDTTPKADYIELAESCMNGNANGFDLGIRHGGCADAAKSCLEHAVDPGRVCTGDVMAGMVGGLSESGCNEGKLSNGGFFGSDTCDRLKAANQAAIDAKANATAEKAKQACAANGSEEAKTLALEACVRSIQEACDKPALDVQGRLVDKDSYGKYEQCVEEAYYKKAANAEECKLRDGVYMNDRTTGPRGENAIDAGCYKQASDLINENACKAANQGFVWKETGKNPDGSSVWSCVDPENPNGEGPEEDKPVADCLTRIDENGNEVCVGDVFEEPAEKCGDARTNIISCDGQGATALGNVLRIFVIVLSIGIGIAAVGGIAWASTKYAKAEDNASDVSEARTIIRNIIIGLFLYGFLLAIVEWLVPGGVIGS